MENRKRLLLVNDDDIDARGIRILAEHLGKNYDVYVCAPDRQRSASSHRVTYFLKDLYASPVTLAGAKAAYRLDGTPADCTYAGLNGLFDDVVFDCVVSGINAGWNTASDIAYSGTVSAALEGNYLGYPALALSLDDYDMEHGDYSKAVEYGEKLLKMYLEDERRSSYVLNVNVPKGEVLGMEAAVVGGIFPYSRRLEKKKIAEGVIRILRPEDPVPDMEHPDPRSDVAVLRRHCAAVTPLTRFGDVDRERMKEWENRLTF